MRRCASLVLILIPVLLSAGCCGIFHSKERKYKKEMECATRLTDDTSIRILKTGKFCCTALPEKMRTLPEARRFYLLRAWGYKPASFEAPMEIARSYADEQNWSEALRYYDAARSRSGNGLAAVTGEVTMYRLLGKYDEALAWTRWLRTIQGSDGIKVADYMEARCLYDEGKLKEAESLFVEAVKRSEKSGVYIGSTTYTISTSWFYLAQIELKTGDPMAAHRYFLKFLKHMSDPDFQTYYAYWMPRLSSHQADFYDKLENDRIHVMQ